MMNLTQVIMRDQTGQEGLQDLINNIPNKGTMIEIGTFTGESTVIFGDHFEKVIGIDPMLQDYDPQDPTSKFNFNEVLEMFNERTKSYDNISLIQKTSDDALGKLTGRTFDFIYIDGIHQYENVKQDIINYLPMVKKGGVIGGHDYGPSWPGVKQAVDEMFGQPDKVFQDTSWIKFI